MGKTSKWLRSFLTGKKDKDKEKCMSNQNSSNATENPTTPSVILPTTPKEKRRWSFRRSSATAAAASRDLNSTEPAAPTQLAMQDPTVNNEDEQKKHALVVAAATAAAADAAVAAAQAAAVAAVIRLTTTATGRTSAIEEAAAIKIQSVFRAYLARKALCALKGLVKLQALVRGHLVRKQATATLRCMQALVTVQARALAQRIRMSAEKPPVSHRQSAHRKSTQENCFRNAHPEIDKGMEDNIKIVEMDHGKSKGRSKGGNSYSSHPLTEAEHRFSAHYASHHAYAKQDNYEFSPAPAPAALADMSPRACSSHFEEYSYGTAQSSPQYYSAVSKLDPSRIPFACPRPDYAESLSYDYPLYPNYMANTESSRAKVRSQSAPKSRPDSFERQPSRRRASMEGRNIPRAVRMQRSSSHLGAAAQNIQYPWSMKLDQSAVSLKDSECGSSTSTALNSTNYSRSLVAYDHHENRY